MLVCPHPSVWLRHIPLGSNSAALGSSPAPLPCVGASSHIQCMGREQAVVLWLSSGLRAGGTSLSLQIQPEIASPGIGSCFVGARGNLYPPVFPKVKTMLQELLIKQKLTLPGGLKQSHGDIWRRDSGGKLKELYEAASKGGTWEVPA